MASNSTYSPPLARLTPDDHRAPLWVATLICLVFVVLGVITRLYVRFKALGLDDYIIGFAFLLGLGQFMTIIAGLVRGLGQSQRVLSDDKLASMGQVFLASEALFVVTLYVVKASVLSTVERILGPDQKTQRLICWVLQGVTGLCGVASLIVVLVSCDGASLLTGQRNEQCSGQTPRWIAITILDAISEVYTFVVFCFFMSSLQMQKRLKVTVTLLLAFRLVCVVFASIHAKYINAYVNSARPGIGVTGALVWQQLNLAYSLISALLIALKAFLQSFDMKFGNDQTYAQNSRSGGNRYNLKPLSKSNGGSKFASRTWDKVSRKEQSQLSRSDEYGNGAAGYSTKVYHGGHSSDEREGSVESGISQHPIIRYQVDIRQDYEDAPPTRGGAQS